MITATVTRADIRGADRNYYCPIVRSLHRQGLTDVVVTTGWLYLGAARYRSSRRASAFMMAWDEGRTVKPQRVQFREERKQR